MRALEKKERIRFRCSFPCMVHPTHMKRVLMRTPVQNHRTNHALAHWQAGVAIPVQKLRKPPSEKVYLFLHITYNPPRYIFAFFT